VALTEPILFLAPVLAALSLVLAAIQRPPNCRCRSQRLIQVEASDAVLLMAAFLRPCDPCTLQVALIGCMCVIFGDCVSPVVER